MKVLLSRLFRQIFTNKADIKIGYEINIVKSKIKVQINV